MKILNSDNNAVSIFDCAWDHKTRVLDSSLPINFYLKPPETLEVIGKYENVEFHFDSSDGSLCRTLYKNDKHNITLYVPWWNEHRNMIVT